MDDVIERAIEEEESLRAVQDYAAEHGVTVVDELVRRGKDAYRQKNLNEAIFFWSASLTRLGVKTEVGSGGSGDDGSGSDGSGSDGSDEGHRSEWVDAMIKRAKILGYVAAASQKRGRPNDLKEASEKFAEAGASMIRVIEEGSRHGLSVSLSSCVLAKAWFMRASSEADCAAVYVMSEKQERRKRINADAAATATAAAAESESEEKKKKKEKKDDVVIERQTENNISQQHGLEGGVQKFQQVLQTYEEAYLAATRCVRDEEESGDGGGGGGDGDGSGSSGGRDSGRDGGGSTMVASVRSSWINTIINLAHAHKNIGDYEKGREVLRMILDENQDGTTTIVKEKDAIESQLLMTLRKRALNVDGSLKKKIERKRRRKTKGLVEQEREKGEL